MHLFRIGHQESPSNRWHEAFTNLRVEQPPFADSVPSGTKICWVSTGVPDWQERVKQWISLTRVVVISWNPSDDEAIAALDIGAHGYCHGLAATAMLQNVAHTVLAGGLWVGPSVMARMIRTLRHSLAEEPKAPPANFEKLTEREREVALAVTTGASNKEIGRQLGLSESTVKMHLGNIFQKLDVRDRLHLVLYLAKG